MAKYLFIVESPNKCQKIKSFLGSDYDVKASVGHIRQIPPKGINIDIKNGFEPTYEISKDKKDVVKKLKEAAQNVEKIYLASDADREGEAIAYSVYSIFDSKCQKKCCRITFNEITKKAISEALKSPREIDMNLVDAQKARTVLDRLIGYKISPILWYTVAKKTSAGRVQSIALKMVCEREKEIQAFKPQDFWYIDALLKCENGEFSARVVTKDKDNRYIEEKLATEDLEKLRKARYKINSIEKKERKVEPHPPFDTSSLQSTCSSVFGWSVKKTASIAQSLYETGFCTYIRSDSYSISEEALAEVRDLIKNSGGSDYLPSKPNIYHKKSKAAAQEAHECIRPTHVEDKGEGIEDPDAKKLYKLLRDRFIACQMTPMIVDTVIYNTKANTGHDLISKGQTIKFDGWYKVYKYTSTKEEVLPVVKEKEELELKGIECTKNQTQPPARYNEGSLIKKMEAEGVGRPSTYPTIMESIQKREYVEKIKDKKGALGATQLGMRVFDFLNPHFKDFFMDVSYTASIEGSLDDITSGDKKFLEVVESVYEAIQKELKQVEKNTSDSNKPKMSDITTGEKCLACGEGEIVKRHGKFGDFFACTKYPTCKAVFTQKEDGGYEIKEKKALQETGEKCLKCKVGNIIIRKGPYSDFFCCSNYPKCKCVFEKDENGKFSLKQFKPTYSKKGKVDKNDNDNSESNNGEDSDEI
jgi:DNA topoisomerase-1